jgi:site-specific DNA recombinase
MRQRLADLEAQARKIQEEMALQEELQQVICRLEDFAATVKHGLEEADWATRRDLIRALVRRVEIGKEEVKVVFRIPHDPDILTSHEKSLQHCSESDLAVAREHRLAWV